ncbi:MerR family transcriptional regulator [Megamonas hypermegale]|uniref:MerR family transcriptional regulator n=1 Tax=Megamonas hypermegale TaxID=158847 RepID=A0A921L888_9FIRM|nr:MerR family transcriptional regulator [Megamonas hypermegale]MDM8143003.1 MerR family transcriptional regulator [Megamonas hypermegale]HJF85498.1 MerR family transcriptional regulator [Megamonas hypermegale]
MYTMKQACKLTNLPYETLKFYCNEGLIPNIKRDKNNYRVFDERNIRWINNMQCLKRCGMSIKEMKDYLKLCLEGQPTIPARMEMLAKHRKELLAKINELNENLAYLDYKNEFYQNVLDGKIPYKSDLIRTDD